MALWVLKATAPGPIRIRDGPGHTVKATSWEKAQIGGESQMQYTFLIDAEPATGDKLAELIGSENIADACAEPAPDGTYSNATGRGVVVEGGRITGEA